jgi:hypothetical protein
MTRERKQAVKATLKLAPAIENPASTNPFASTEYLEAIVNGEQWTRYEDSNGRRVSREAWLEDTRRGLLSDIMGILYRPDPATLYKRSPAKKASRGRS